MINPTLDLSIRYHNPGFAKANVKAACEDDSHGNLLFFEIVSEESLIEQD